jgi:hypothetical protein
MPFISAPTALLSWLFIEALRCDPPPIAAETEWACMRQNWD